MAISPTYLGQVGNTGVYRVSLADLSASAIGSIAIFDDRVVSGGTGGASGFDLDFITISSAFTSSASTAASFLSRPAQVTFTSPAVAAFAGFQQAWSVGDPASWNTPFLHGFFPGTQNTQINFGVASFGVRDGDNNGSLGALALGEGGAVSFILNSFIPTAGMYLYFGDDGGGNDTVFVDAGQSRSHSLLPSGLTLKGTSGADDMRLGVGINSHLGPKDDNLNGSGGNDTIWGGAGNDRIAGAGGNDIIDGGLGRDTAVFQGARSQYTITTSSTGVIVADSVSNRDGTDQLSNIEVLKFANDQVFRFTNVERGGHLFTTSAAERDSIIKNLPGYKYEGVEFYANNEPEDGSSPVFRFLNTVAGSHLFTTSEAERDSIIQNLPGLKFEGVAYFASKSPQQGYEESYRFLNTTTGGHFFTTSETERDSVIKNLPGFRYEGIGYYVPEGSKDWLFEL